MIPEICANCAKGDNVTNQNGEITLTMCGALPIILGQTPTHHCGMFAMTSNPPVVVPDEQPGPPCAEGTGEPGQMGTEGETTAERGLE